MKATCHAPLALLAMTFALLLMWPEEPTWGAQPSRGTAAEPGASPGASPQKDFAAGDPYAVVSVLDGDTVLLRRGTEGLTLGLIGVEAPQAPHPGKLAEFCGEEATTFLKDLLNGETVHLRDEPGLLRADTERRTLAYLYRVRDGLFVNLEMLRQGYARVDTDHRFSKMELFQEAEGEAQQAGKGLWVFGSSGQATASLGENPFGDARGGRRGPDILVTSDGQRLQVTVIGVREGKLLYCVGGMPASPLPLKDIRELDMAEAPWGGPPADLLVTADGQRLHVTVIAINEGRLLYCVVGIPASPLPLKDIRELDLGAAVGGTGERASAEGAMPGTSRTADGSMTVQVTSRGLCYHLAGCTCIRSGDIALSLAEAVQEGYLPCPICRPPTLARAATAAADSGDSQAKGGPPAPAPPPIRGWGGLTIRLYPILTPRWHESTGTSTITTKTGRGLDTGVLQR